MDGRLCILTKEAMIGEVASEYDILGRESRNGTYKKIVEDFKNRTGCYAMKHPDMNVGTILEVGCGSGLISLELAQQTNGEIIGIDLSSDMIQLAKHNLLNISNEEKERIIEFWSNLSEKYKPTTDKRKELEDNPPLINQVTFIEGNAYNLAEIIRDEKNVNYIVCRNALHRFQYPEKAIEQMYSVLNTNGKIYIRDIKRDADWKTIIDRIGEKRWQKPVLVEDYLGAMASMLTTSELEQTLDKLLIKDYVIGNGNYISNSSNHNNIAEFEKEVEYTCVITKHN
ncbi:MAG: class I SAM-dependent methyltransferase [Candidatus Woesearchaeota archaeon]